jgi:E3 ubiquitin-protein ligase HUWE1
LIAQIAELLSSAHDVGDCVLTAAVLSLDGCARHRSKLSEVTASLSASVGHGLLMTLFRFVVRTEHSYELVDALLQFLGMLVGSPTHGNMLMSAGVLPLILELTGHQGPRRDNYIPRACGLIDTIMFAVTQGMSMLSNADGLNILVNRIKDEINMDWHPSHSEIVSEDSALAYAASPLKAFLRSVHRLMTATGGTEGLRNLVDTDLPKSLKWVFENPTRFGDRVLSLCINIMATFVHNEPTSLSILQELQLPQTLYTKLEDAMPRSYDVIVAVPGAIGAVCLNPAGLKYTSEHPKVMTNLIDVALSSEVKDTPIDRDHAATVGAALDELVRHHPPLRPIVQDKVFALLREATEAGSAFEPPEDQLKDYAIDAMTAELAPKEAPTNEPLNRFAKIFRLLEGVLRNGIICKDFVREGGIEILLGVADLPCVPIKFGGTEAATHLSHVLRSITEHDHIILVGRMINSIEQAMERCTHFWQGDDVHDVWMKMHRGETETIDRDQFKQLRGLAIRLTYLSDSFLGVSFSHSRIATSLIKALRANQTFLPNLATLHRVAFREHATLQTTLPSSASPTSVVEGEIDPSKESGAKFLATRMNAILAKFWKCEVPWELR